MYPFPQKSDDTTDVGDSGIPPNVLSSRHPCMPWQLLSTVKDWLILARMTCILWDAILFPVKRPLKKKLADYKGLG